MNKPVFLKWNIEDHLHPYEKGYIKLDVLLHNETKKQSYRLCDVSWGADILTLKNKFVVYAMPDDEFVDIEKNGFKVTHYYLSPEWEHDISKMNDDSAT